MKHGEDANYEALVTQRKTLTAAKSAPQQMPAAVSTETTASLQRRLLFPQLAAHPIRLMGPDDDREAAAEHTQDALCAITKRMLGPLDKEDLSANPAAFTYFGQFVFHDMVFSRIFGTPDMDRNDRRFGNASSGSLDLSGLYGRGPVVDPHLYDCASETDSTLCRFPLGLPRVRDRNLRDAIDGKAERARDLPRIDGSGGFLSVCGRKEPHRPLVADPRNDDNLILSQFHCTLMQAHNRIVDVLVGQRANSPRKAFNKARAYLTGVYRSVVVSDYMARMLDPGVWKYFFGGEHFRGPGSIEVQPLVDLPIEFSFGASRFAHSMVRDRYIVNDAIDTHMGTLRSVLSFTSQRANGETPIRVNWAVDWKRFAQFGDEPAALRARRISPFLTYEMSSVKNATDMAGVPRTVVFMDNWRCYHLGLPSGQAVAKAVADKLAKQGINVPQLSGEEMLPTEACRRRYPYHAGELDRILNDYPQFLNETPLSYYVLQEASQLGDDGNRLGPVGSYIVGATVASALSATDDADLPAPIIERTQTLAGLLSLADETLVSDKQLEDEIERAFQPPMAARTGRRTGSLAS
jgi:hypothetical protein